MITWPSFPADNELVFKDATGGLSIFDAESLTSRVLVTNITFVSIGPLAASAGPLGPRWFSFPFV